MKQEQSKMPMWEHVKKAWNDLLGRPFLWVDFEYLPKQELSEVQAEYNSYFLDVLADLGYDVADPESAVREYISNCVSTVLSQEEDDWA